MKLTDSRLHHAKNLEDFAFRLHWREEDNRHRRNAIREQAGILKGNFALGVLGTSFIAPDTERIFGADVSDWDGEVNLQVFKDYGGDFVIIKAIDGTVPSRYWQANHQRAEAVGMPHGPYGWLYPDNRVNCTLQAQAYYNLIKDVRFQIPPVIDFEWTKYAGMQANPNYSDLDKWVTKFTYFSGVKPILYSAAGYMNMFGRMPDSLRDKFCGFWFASYGGLSLPYGFSHYDIHQFTAAGDALLLCPGSQNKKELDLNYMTQAFYDKHITVTTPQPEQPGAIMARYEVTTPSTSRVALRPNHDTNNDAHGYIPTGTKLACDEDFVATVRAPLTGTAYQNVGDRWAKVSYAFNGITYVGWVAITHLGAAVCGITEVNPPPAEEVLAKPRRLMAEFEDGTTAWYVAE